MTTIRTDLSEALQDNDYAYLVARLDDIKGPYAALYVLQALQDSGVPMIEALSGIRKAINLR
jgi:DNA-binding phage protein